MQTWPKVTRPKVIDLRKSQQLWIEVKGQWGQGERSVGSRWKVMCVNWLVRLAGGLMSTSSYIFEQDLAWVEDVLMGIRKSDLLEVTMAVIHIAGQRILAVWNGLNKRRYSNLDFENCCRPWSCIFCTQKLCHISELTIDRTPDTYTGKVWRGIPSHHV